MIRPVCSSTIMILLSMITYSTSFSNKEYAFNNCVKVWIRSLLILKSWNKTSFSSASASLSNFFFSILAISVPISGKTKKSASVSPDRNLIPLSVNSTWLFFSSITKYKASSILCISRLLSCMY